MTLVEEEVWDPRDQHKKGPSNGMLGDIIRIALGRRGMELGSRVLDSRNETGTTET